MLCSKHACLIYFIKTTKILRTPGVKIVRSISLKKGWLENINFLIKSDPEKASGRHIGSHISLQFYLCINKDRRVSKRKNTA
jgi:hypothetical protein